MKELPEFAHLSEFSDGFYIRDIAGETERVVSALSMEDGEATTQIENFDYGPMIKEVGTLAKKITENPADTELSTYMFYYRAVARHIIALYLHIDQYRMFRKTYDNSSNFLDQNFGLAKDHVPDGLEILALDAEKSTRGYGPEVDTVDLLKQGKLSFVLAYPDYACAYVKPGCNPTDVHKLDAAAYMLGGNSEKYFKLMHLAVESKMGPLVKAAQATIDGVASVQRAALLNAAADAARDATSAIIKMPELSDPADYLHLRWFIQGPYNSPSYPNGLTVRGVRIAPGGETGSQSSFAIMSDLLSGARFNFQDDMLNKMEAIHRTTREQETILFLDRLRAAAAKLQSPVSVCDEEKHARARLLQATNFYLLGHAAAYTIHVLAQQKSTVVVDRKVEVADTDKKEDVATGGSAGSFLIKKVIERLAFLDKMIAELNASSCPFDGKDAENNKLFAKQLDLVKNHTQGIGRDKALDLSMLKQIVEFSEEKAVGIKPPSA